MTLSRVITDCGSILVICSRKSMVARTESRNGQDRVQAGFRAAVIAAEPLDDLDLFLRDDLDGAHQHDQDEDRQSQEHQAVGDGVRDAVDHEWVTSSTMPSAPMTRIFVPAAMASVLRAAQSSPATFTRPVPMRGSMSCVTMPGRPTSDSVRDGTPLPPSRVSSADRSRTSDSGHDDDERGRAAPAR